MITALLIVLAGALGGVVIVVTLWKNAELREANAVKALELSRTEADVLRVELAAATRLAGEDRTRLEKIIATLKADIAALESDLHACNSPGIVRERLRRLLSPPDGSAASSNGVGPYGTMPFGTPAKPSGG